MGLRTLAGAAERNLELTRASIAEGHEFVSYHYRWLDHLAIPEDQERTRIRPAFQIFTSLVGIQNHGFSTAARFTGYVIDCFDTLCAARAHYPRRVTRAIHDRIGSRRGRVPSVVRCRKHAPSRVKVWIATGRDIAEH